MKKRIASKTTALLLALLIVAGLLAACSGSAKEDDASPAPAQEDSQASPAQDEVGIHMMFAGFGFTFEGNPESTVAKALSEKTGVIIDKVTNVDSTGSMDLTSMQLAFATGDLPDVVVFAQAQPTHSDMYNKLTQDDQLLDLREYITDETPNLKAMLTNEIYSKLHTDVDADPIYAVPIAYPSSDEDTSWAEVAATLFAREDWLEIVGIDAGDIKTNEDLYNLLKAFKEQIPDVNGMPILPATLGESGTWWNDLSKELSTPWFHYTPEGTMITQHTSDMYVEQMAWMGKVYGEGLLDKEAYTHKQDVWAEKVTTGRVGVFPCNLAKLVDEFNPQLAASVPGARFVPLYNMIDGRSVGADGKAESGVWYSTPDIKSYSCIVSESADKADAILRMMDYIASEEGQLLVNLGVEGETWEMKDGGPALKPDVYQRYASGERGKLITETGLMIYNIAGNKQVFEITGGSGADDYNWQYLDKTTEQYQFKELIVKEVRMGMNPDPATFVTSLANFNEKIDPIYSAITPLQNKALTATSEAEARAQAEEIVALANELGMEDFLKYAAEEYKIVKDRLAG